AWYTYDGDQLGQGKENARQYLKDNPGLTDDLERQIKEKLGVGTSKAELTVVSEPEEDTEE
ncbi:DNA recombination/repair protein RecA, partial [bacterium]|nr:DNA recombination/repair protein RecA [bacterium]